MPIAHVAIGPVACPVPQQTLDYVNKRLHRCINPADAALLFIPFYNSSTSECPILPASPAKDRGSSFPCLCYLPFNQDLPGRSMWVHGQLPQRTHATALLLCMGLHPITQLPSCLQWEKPSSAAADPNLQLVFIQQFLPEKFSSGK